MPPEPSFLTPSTSEEVAREAEILVLRNIGVSLERVMKGMDRHTDDMAQMKTDIAVIKERQAQNADFRDALDAMRAEILALKARNDKQDGAYSLATAAKEFGPWLFSLLALAWGLFVRKP